MAEGGTAVQGGSLAGGGERDGMDALMGTSLQGGRFVISGVLGKGAQGDTLEAVDKQEGRAVAVKRFQVRGARSWKDVELAEREARVLSALDHPLLPAAIAHFEQDGALYLVMDKVEGRTLQQLGSMSQRDVLAFLYDAAQVLDYLHSRSPPVIHRDIKPGNVIARPARAELGEQRQRYVLVDFGSVRDQLRPAGGSTVVGTFGYMAPEQFQGRARAASDVYAVGVTALRMLTGREPEDLPHRGLGIDVDAALGNSVAPPLRQLLRQLVEPDPDKRPSRIKPLLAGLAPAVTPAPARARAQQPQQASAQPDRERGRHSGRRERRQQRHEQRWQRRHERAQRRQQARWARGERGWLPAFQGMAMVGLWVAQLAVLLALGVAVPLLLTLLSLVFGRGLRVAADKVRLASRRARQAMQRAQQHVNGQSVPDDPERQRFSGSRIEVPVPHGAGRIAEPLHHATSGHAVVDEAIAEAEYEAASALDDVAREVREVSVEFRRRPR